MPLHLYNNALLARHPLLRSLGNNAAFIRPAVRIWSDSSLKGYGAHFGPADQPIATFQQKRLTSLPPPKGKKRLELQTNHVHVHEAAALYLSLDHFRPLLRGATIVAHTDNTVVLAAFGGKGTRESKGLGDISAIVQAVKTLVRTDDMDLEVRLVTGKNNRLADALSRFPRNNSIEYPEIIKAMREHRLEGSKAAKELIKKIAAVSSMHKYAEDKETSNSATRHKLDQEPSSLETVTCDTSSWELVEKDISPAETTVHLLPFSISNDVENAPDADGFEQAELPTEIRRDEFNALFLAMEKTEASNAKNAKVRRLAVKTVDSKAVKPISERSRMRKERKGNAEEMASTPDKVVVATKIDTTIQAETTKTLSDTSIEAAENLIKQAQELVKAATKLMKGGRESEINLSTAAGGGIR